VKLIIAQLVKKLPHFMEHEGSLPCPREVADYQLVKEGTAPWNYLQERRVDADKELRNAFVHETLF